MSTSTITSNSTINVRLAIQLGVLLVGLTGQYFFLKSQITDITPTILKETDTRYVAKETNDLRFNHLSENQSRSIESVSKDIALIQRDVNELRHAFQDIPQINAKLDELFRALEVTKK